MSASLTSILSALFPSRVISQAVRLTRGTRPEYEFTAQIGGGMGELYRACDTSDVALKILPDLPTRATS
jgi:hypothetical protein